MNLCSGYKGICGVISGWKEVQLVSEPEQSVCTVSSSGRVHYLVRGPASVNPVVSGCKVVGSLVLWVFGASRGMRVCMVLAS